MQNSKIRFAVLVVISVSTISLALAREPSLRRQFSVPDLVYSIDVSQDGRLVAAGSRGDGSETLRLFDSEKGEKRWSAAAGNYVWNVAFSPDGQLIVSGSDAGLMIWEVRGGRAPMVLSSATATLPEVKHIAISPAGKLLAASRGTSIEVWDLPRRRLLRTIKTSGGGAVAFAPDEQQLAVAGYHNRLTIFDVASGEPLGEIHAMIGILKSVDYSTDGKTLAVCSEGVTKIFSIEQTDEKVNLAELAALRGGLSVDISGSGKWVASGGYEGKVLICDSSHGDPIGTIDVAGQRDSIYGVKFCEEDSQIVVAGMLGRGPERNGVVQVWDITELTGRPAAP